MPWNLKLANYLVIAQDSGLITPKEYETIRATMELQAAIADRADGAGQAGATAQAANGTDLESTIRIAGSGFRFGKSSETELVGVVPQFVKVIRFALTISEQDFCVYEGGRTLKEQVASKARGTSQTLDSYHLPQKDGLVHACDLVPWINGKPVWDWVGCYKIAHAMDLAATHQGCAHMITWGAAWDRTLADFGGDLGSYEQEMEAYAKRHPGKDFVDGPHFQWKR